MVHYYVSWKETKYQRAEQAAYDAVGSVVRCSIP